MQPSTCVQAIGRMMRPQFETYVRDGWGHTGDRDDDDDARRRPVGRADKWLVLLEEAAPAAPVAIDNSSEEEL